MIAIIQGSIKRNSSTALVPINTLNLQILKLLRQQGIIFGFSLVYKNDHYKLYAKIQFKYVDNNTPILRSIKAFPNTQSNFYYIKNSKHYQTLSDNKLYILTTGTGIILTSFEHAFVNKISSNVPKLRGRLLAVLTI